MSCSSYALCSSHLDYPGGCTVQYGTDPSYDDLSLPIKGPINSVFLLPVMEGRTVYYHQTTITVDSESVAKIIVRSVHRTGYCDLQMTMNSKNEVYTYMSIL